MTMEHPLSYALGGKLLFPFIAPPNGGKGTQTQALLKTFPNQLRHIDMGGLLRAVVADADNPLGEKIRTAQAEGQLVNIDIVMAVLAEGMADEAAKAPTVLGFILDGFPRNNDQLANLDQLCEQTGAQLAKAFFLDVPHEVIIKRASGRIFEKETHKPFSLNNPALHPPGYNAATFDLENSNYYQRDDDKPETVQKRLQGFADETQPMADALEQRGAMVTIDGNQPPEAITAVLMDTMNSYLTPATFTTAAPPAV